jgi:hypothetical protein
MEADTPAIEEALTCAGAWLCIADVLAPVTCPEAKQEKLNTPMQSHPRQPLHVPLHNSINCSS